MNLRPPGYEQSDPGPTPPDPSPPSPFVVLATPSSSQPSPAVPLRPVASRSRIWSRVLSRPRRASTAPHPRVARKGHFMTGGGRMSGISSARSASVDPSLQPRMQPLLYQRIQARGQLVDAPGKDRWVDQTGLEHGRRECEVLLPIRHEFGHNAVVRLQKSRQSPTGGLVLPGDHAATPTLREHRGPHANPLCVHTVHLVEWG